MICNSVFLTIVVVTLSLICVVLYARLREMRGAFEQLRRSFALICHEAQKAAEERDRAEDALRRVHEPDFAAQAAAFTRLADDSVRVGNYSSAEPMYKRALKTLLGAFNDEHPDAITNLKRLAALYRASDREAWAVSVERRIEQRIQRTRGELRG
jgi:hypothetical protein